MGIACTVLLAITLASPGWVTTPSLPNETRSVAPQADQSKLQASGDLNATSDPGSDDEPSTVEASARAGALVSEAVLQDQIRIARSRVGRIEVHGPFPDAIVCQATAFLLEPDLAVTSAFVLSNGHGVRLFFNGEVRGASLCGLDLMHDVALLRLTEKIEVDSGLPLKAADLVGNETVAVVGQTVLMEEVARRASLTGSTSIPPLRPFAQVQNLADKGLAGMPLLDGRGRVIGMLSSRMLEESGTRMVVSGSAIAQLACAAPVAIHQHMIPGIPGNETTEEYQAWAAQEQGIALLLAGHADRSAPVLQEARGERARMWLAIAYMQLGRHVEALQVLAEVVATNQSSVEAHLLMGQAQANLGEHREAASEWQKARSLGRDAILPTLALAQGYTQVNREQDSLGLLKGLLNASPDYVPALLLRGQIMNRRLRFPEARGYFEKVLEIDGRNPSAWVGLGEMHLNQKRLKRALQCFDEALTIKAGLLSAHVGRCEVALRQKDWQGALDLTTPLLAQHPQQIDLMVVAAKALSRLGKLEQALALYEEVTILQPSHVAAHYGMGMTFKEMFKFDRAVVSLDEVLRLDPQHSGALFNAGVCHLMAGDRGAARARHKHLQRIDPAAADRLFKMIYNK